MPEYAVHVTTTATIDPDDEAVWENLMDALVPFHASIGAPDGRFDAQLTVEASAMAVALVAAERAVLDALAGVGIVLPDDGIAGVEVLTPAEFDRQLAEPRAEDLMTTAEVAARLEVSRQRVLVLADEHPEFPPVVRTAGRGLFFHRRGVERFAAQRAPRRSPDPMAATS